MTIDHFNNVNSNSLLSRFNLRFGSYLSYFNFRQRVVNISY